VIAARYSFTKTDASDQRENGIACPLFRHSPCERPILNPAVGVLAILIANYAQRWALETQRRAYFPVLAQFQGV
jgi:hypothetical protein